MKAKYIIGFIILAVAVVGLAIWVGSSSTIKTTDKSDPNRPVAEVKEKEFNLGEMSVKEIKDHNFTIKNTGKTNLALSHVSTSCDCTYAYIINSAGQKSQKFTMHGTDHSEINVLPNESATLQVVYEPAIMPVMGAVERFVTVATNDPSNPKLEFKITMKVNQ